MAPKWYEGEGLPNWPGDNLGDGPLNIFLLFKLFPNLNRNAENPRYYLLGIGSILGTYRRFNGVDKELPVLVYGSGFQYGSPQRLPRESRIFCVRGRYTCQMCSVDEKLAAADPGILMPYFLNRQVDCIPGRVGRFYKWNYGAIHIPDSNVKALAIQSVRLLQYARLHVNSLLRAELGSLWGGRILYTSRTHGDLFGLIRHIWLCEKIESDSLHVAVIADAYGIPWRPLRWEPKWEDHFSMLGIDRKPETFVLSDRKLLQQKITFLLEKRDELIDYVEHL